MIIPSIDIMNGNAVQLQQGKKKMLEVEDVLGLARKFGKFGEIAVIDLDAALGKGNNLDLIKQICKIAECRVGGGIRTVERAKEMIKAGAKKVIIGTKANKDFLSQLPKDKVIVAIDSKDGFVVNKGWQNNTGKKTEEVVKELEDYCSGFLYTIVEDEGMLKGIDIDKIKKVKENTDRKIIAAGGVKSIEEIKELDKLGIDCQVGMALYTGKIDLVEAFVSVLDFKNGLIPTIVQDINGQVLMLGFSNKDSLKKSFETGKATYFSRSRQKQWIKGETSGNFQELLNVKVDCDRDTLLFTVKQKNVACHKGDYSCFDDKKFDLNRLYEVVLDRIQNPKEGSYTSKIAGDEKKIMEKLKEEAGEVVNYKDNKNLVWEIGDLMYFMIMLMAKNGITINEVINELESRRK